MSPRTRPPLAMIATRIYEPEGAAAAYRLGNLVRTLEGAGYLVTVLTSALPGGPPSTKAVRRWPVLRDRSGAVRGYLQYLSFDLPLFFRLIFGPRADVVVVEPPPTTGLVARVACWLRRTPYVYFAADVLSSAVKGINAPRFVVSAVTWLERRAVRGAAGVLAVSDDVKQQVTSLGADPLRVAMVGTGIDTDQFGPHGPIASTTDPYFVYAGTMSEVHGATVFIDAFATLSERHPDVRLRVFGAGTELDEMAERAMQLNGRVEFLGIADASQLAPWIRGATACLASVRPGRGYDFAYATKALTSLSCGTAVIYAGTGPLGPLVAANELGWATEWSSASVAEAMEAALGRGHVGPDARLSAWVEQNHSLRAVSSRAVAAIEGFLAEQKSRNALG